MFSEGVVEASSQSNSTFEEDTPRQTRFDFHFALLSVGPAPEVT